MTSILFTFYYLRPWATSVLFLFSVNPMLQRRSFSCFFSMGLISNAHRVERSTNFLIMEKRKLCRRPRPCGGCSCPACESIARQRKRICRVIVRRLALDSSRLKSTGDQGKIGLRNTKARVLQVLFGMLHLMGGVLSAFIYSRIA